MLRYFINLFSPKKRRVHDAEPREDLLCEWCEEVKHTTINEIWCRADPTGHLTRLCDNCREGCAG